jgi:hypothetical protein
MEKEEEVAESLLQKNSENDDSLAGYESLYQLLSSELPPHLFQVFLPILKSSSSYQSVLFF